MSLDFLCPVTGHLNTVNISNNIVFYLTLQLNLFSFILAQKIHDGQSRKRACIKKKNEAIQYNI